MLRKSILARPVLSMLLAAGALTLGGVANATPMTWQGVGPPGVLQQPSTQELLTGSPGKALTDAGIQRRLVIVHQKPQTFVSPALGASNQARPVGDANAKLAAGQLNALPALATKEQQEQLRRKQMDLR